MGNMVYLPKGKTTSTEVQEKRGPAKRKTRKKFFKNRKQGWRKEKRKLVFKVEDICTYMYWRKGEIINKNSESRRSKKEIERVRVRQRDKKRIKDKVSEI